MNRELKVITVFPYNSDTEIKVLQWGNEIYRHNVCDQLCVAPYNTQFGVVKWDEERVVSDMCPTPTWSLFFDWLDLFICIFGGQQMELEEADIKQIEQRILDASNIQAIIDAAEKSPTEEKSLILVPA